MTERFSLCAPLTCPNCRGLGTVKLEHTIKGSSVNLTCCCEQCGHDWTATEHEVTTVERRSGTGDRRKITRSDRRIPKRPG